MRKLERTYHPGTARWMALGIAGMAVALVFSGAGRAAALEAPLSSLPTLLKAEPVVAYIANNIKNNKSLDAAGKTKYAEALGKYMAFLGLDPTANKDLFSVVYNRLLSSSTQFLVCPSLEDWSCLETSPALKPKLAFRQETSPNLGQAVKAGAKLDITAYFTQLYDEKDPTRSQRSATLAKTLAGVITQYATKSLSLAIYGIDDITDSMKPVYDAIVGAVGKHVNVRAVFDILAMRTYDVTMGSDNYFALMRRTKPIQFSYVSAASGKADDYADNGLFGRPKWLQTLQATLKTYKEKVIKTFSASSTAKDAFTEGDFKTLAYSSKTVNKGGQEDFATAVRTKFQYAATAELMKVLNNGIAKEEDAKGRIEWPEKDIMHNKFMVLESTDGSKSVWTGTANVARTCIGTEENSNMALFIKNNAAIAGAYLTEFEEMFQPAVTLPGRTSDGTTFVSSSGGSEIKVGKFKTAKSPNSNRYFTFGDGTEARVHFSPTDDAEHRVILPMLLSAQAGDDIRVSMFGAGGTEIIRAFQLAIARGANVKIVLDGQTGASVGSWTKDKFSPLGGENPYVALLKKTPGKLQVRYSDWKGLNHQKVGSLTRGGVAQMIVIGSQNWSAAGNDQNDENVFTVRNKKGVKIATEFNQHFDTMLWAGARKKVVGD